MANSSNGRKRLIAIVGSTGSGKSALAVALALRLNSQKAKKRYGINGAEVISADSRQIYKEIPVGTGAVTAREMRGVTHHLLAVASLRRRYTVTQYQRAAHRAIRGIWRRGKIPILCGGTGLYVNAVVDGVVFPEVPPNKKLRARLAKKSTEELYRILRARDPRRAREIDRHNPRRLVRALEITAARGKVPASRANPIDADVLILGLRPSPAKLEKRTRARIRAWLRRGLLPETEKIPDARIVELGLVYRSAKRLARGEITRSEFISELTQNIMKYVKRQETWFARDPRIEWTANAREGISRAERFLE